MDSCALFLSTPRPPPPLVPAHRRRPLASRSGLRRREGCPCSCASSSSSSGRAGSQDRPPRPWQQKQRTQRPGRGEAIDPVGFLAKHGISDRAFAQFLRDRYKALKDRRWELHSRLIDLKEASSGFELMGMHRHRQHRVDFMEWAPGARYCSVVGDFNQWSTTENCAREGHLGHDDFGYWTIILEDKLREGQEPDEYYFQEYNYADDYDKGDNGVDVEELIHRMNEEYWEPGEIKSQKSRLEVVAKLYEQMFGPNGPQTEEELGDIPDAETRYNEWKALQKDDSASLLPCYDIIDNGQEFDIFNVATDRVSFEKFQGKSPPLAYWVEMRKGRKAWLEKYVPAISHKDKYRVYFNTPDGGLERIPAWATYVLPDAEGKQSYAVHWDPPPEEIYKWRFERPKVKGSLRIYECHVGISGSEQKISSFQEFTSNVLPHIKDAGYNAIQLIGIVEHKDYSSVGYKVTNYFSVSSRFGSPDDFKKLVDEAHGLGLVVLLDIVHSYASADELVGLSLFDGSNDCYFHSVFFLSPVIFPLLSSLPYSRQTTLGVARAKEATAMAKGAVTTSSRIWAYSSTSSPPPAPSSFRRPKRMEFARSSSVETPMPQEQRRRAMIPGPINRHPSCSTPSPSTVIVDAVELLPEGARACQPAWYYNQYVDEDALIYLIIANEMLHELHPDIITIAEDATFYPGLCEPTTQGGLGFDYWVNLSIPEMWLWHLENVPEQEWSMNKIIKLITFTTSGGAYLNFIGNEFAHPKRIEFPMSSNDYSFCLANRQWKLLDKGVHKHIFNFDKDIMNLDGKERLISGGSPIVHHCDDTSMIISFTRGPFLFVFNFNPDASYQLYSVGVDEAGEYQGKRTPP
uniref:1,4-alpha-glucan branching enzyme n=1 Tax=Oryza nivara TaxID=4536 RepID=A0A0E0HQV4_ORYNI